MFCWPEVCIISQISIAWFKSFFFKSVFTFIKVGIMPPRNHLLRCGTELGKRRHHLSVLSVMGSTRVQYTFF